MFGVGRANVWILLTLLAGPGHALAQCEATYALAGGNCEHQGVACAGDVDHDGTEDWLVGSHGTYAAVYSGADGTIIHEYAEQGTHFGISVSGGGDFDGDEYSDYIIGECNRTVNSPGGRVRLYSGATGEVLRELRAPLGGYNFGCSIAIVGDMNDDGLDDVAVGAHCDQTVGSQAGRVIVYSSADGSIIYDLYGQAAGDHFGYCVAAAGDINNDGWPDLAVGATASSYGRTYIYSGHTGTALYSLGAANEIYGYEVAGIGDANGDGYDDFAVGGFLELCRVTVVSGRNGFALHVIDSPEGTDFFGVSLAGVGDIDRDGCGDILVGAPNSTSGGLGSGRAYLYSGRTGSELFEIGGASENAHLGWSVARAGDPDHNGLGDLLIGSGVFTGVGETSVVCMGQGECTLVHCCSGKVGNANLSAEDEPTIGDISAIVDFLYITGNPLPCLEEADVNHSGGQWPTGEDVTITDISLLIDHLYLTLSDLPDCL